MVMQIRVITDTSNTTNLPHPISTLIPTMGSKEDYKRPKQWPHHHRFNPQILSTCWIPSRAILLTQHQWSQNLVGTVLIMRCYLPPRPVMVWSRLPCMTGSGITANNNNNMKIL